MKIGEVRAKSIITKSNLGNVDYVINPYIGCMHGCKYCYARFMKRFTGHKERWGSFVDVKINASKLIPNDTNKYRTKSITIGSVTDPYHPIEIKYQLTRKILEKLLPLKPRSLDILTKSDLVLRDIKLIKQFKNCTVAISFSSLDDNIRKELEPLADSPNKKLDALRKVHKAGIYTVVFISPIIPEITDWKQIINKTKDFVDEYWLENLNFYPSIRKNMYDFLRKIDSNLIEKYKEIYSDKEYWRLEEREIRNFCNKHNIKYKIYFHHKATK